MNKISACLVVHNEEKVINRCLTSIKDVVDEIIIVHDGKCLDRTLEICCKYTNKVFEFPHNGVAEFYRPFSFEQAKGEWILQIDADEYLSSELKKKIFGLVKKDNVAAYAFFWPLWDGQKIISKKWPYKLCLYKKEKICFLGIPQFVAEVKGRVVFSNLVLAHKPDYNNYSWKSFKEKSIKRAEVHAKTYLKNFNDVPNFNCPKKDWSKRIKFRVNFPLLLLPADLFFVFFKSFLGGFWREGYIGFKVALKIAAYRAVVDYFIYKNK